MPQQLPLFETPEAPPNRYRLLLAIFPDAQATHLINDHQTDLSRKLGLTGKLRPRNILHVTLHHIDDYPEMPEDEITLAINACTSALAGRPSFDVTFDHAKTFRGRPGNLPFVLVNPNGNPALMSLHQPLITELAKHRLASRQDFQFVPHVTMLYDKHHVPEQPVLPVNWTVKEVMLILSHLGLTKYDKLASWELK
jgi:2'-5' RNA ligase